MMFRMNCPMICVGSWITVALYGCKCNIFVVIYVDDLDMPVFCEIQAIYFLWYVSNLETILSSFSIVSVCFLLVWYWTCCWETSHSSHVWNIHVSKCSYEFTKMLCVGSVVGRHTQYFSGVYVVTLNWLQSPRHNSLCNRSGVGSLLSQKNSMFQAME
jgi:hypothetical protein